MCLYYYIQQCSIPIIIIHNRREERMAPSLEINTAKKLVTHIINERHPVRTSGISWKALLFFGKVSFLVFFIAHNFGWIRSISSLRAFIYRRKYCTNIDAEHTLFFINWFIRESWQPTTTALWVWWLPWK